jgi:hypothetical protein
VLVLAPFYFLYDSVGNSAPPPVTHPEFYYGFLAVGLVWQIAFLMIGSDPVRFRPMMIPAMLEKFGYVITLLVLYLQKRLTLAQTMPIVPDGILGVLFVAAFFKVKNERLSLRAQRA